MHLVQGPKRLEGFGVQYFAIRYVIQQHILSKYTDCSAGLGRMDNGLTVFRDLGLLV